MFLLVFSFVNHFIIVSFLWLAGMIIGYINDFCPIFVLYILYCNSTLGSKAANIIPINSCLDTHKLSLNLQRESEVIWSITFPCCRECTWYFWARGDPPPCVLQSSRPCSCKGEQLFLYACGPGSQPRPASWPAVLQKESTKPNPPTQFQTNTHFIYSYSSSWKEKKNGGENSLLNPNTNTILIRIRVRCLLTCIAYNGGYHLGYCVQGTAQSHWRRRWSPQFIQP